MRQLSLLFIMLVMVFLAAPVQAEGIHSSCTGLRCATYHQQLRTALPPIPDMICLRFVQPSPGPVSIFIYYIDPDKKTYAPPPKYAGTEGKFCPGAWRFAGARYVLLCNGPATAFLNEEKVAEVRRLHGLPPGSAMFIDPAFANADLPSDLVP